MKIFVNVYEISNFLTQLGKLVTVIDRSLNISLKIFTENSLWRAVEIFNFRVVLEKR